MRARFALSYRHDPGSWLESDPGGNNHSRGADAFEDVTREQAEKRLADDLSRVSAFDPPEILSYKQSG